MCWFPSIHLDFYTQMGYLTLLAMLALLGLLTVYFRYEERQRLKKQK